MFRFSISLLAIILVRLPQLGIGEAPSTELPEADAVASESEGDASQESETTVETATETVAPTEAAEEIVDSDPPSEAVEMDVPSTESSVDEQEAAARSMASSAEEQPAPETEDTEEKIPETTVTTTIEQTVTTTTTTFWGLLPDLPVFPDEIDDSFIYTLQQLELQSLRTANTHDFHQGAWEYGDYRTASEAKFAVRCAEACEDDEGCHHWNFNLVQRRCNLKEHKGGLDDSRLDWISGCSTRHTRSEEYERHLQEERRLQEMADTEL